MVGENGRKALRTKGFRHGRENGLNISKRFFSLHGLHLLYVWGAFLRIFGRLLYIGLADGAKTAWKGFVFGCVAVLWLGWWILLYDGVNGCVAVFLVSIFKYYFLKFFQIGIIWYICNIIETSMAKVIHVHLLYKIDGTKQKDWYFSSISAVYTVLTAEQVGATKNYLLHAGLSGNGTICTKKAIIKQSTLISGGSKVMVRTT